MHDCACDWSDMMKIIRMFAVLVTAVCILSFLPGAGAMTIQLDPLSTTSVSSASVSAASVNDNYPITEEQAKNSIRIFMNDLTLDPMLIDTGSIEIGNYYTFKVDQDSYTVNQNTGVVEFVHFGAHNPDSAVMNVTRDQAYAIATGYAGQKYEGFAGKTWNLVIDRVYETSNYEYNQTSQTYERIAIKAYDFVLREEKDHILLPSLVHVRINPATGAIVDFWGVDRVLTVSDLTGKITLSNAIQSATDYTYSSFKVNSAEGYLAVVTQSQNVESLAWVITLHGSYTWDPNYNDTYTVVVNANDGSVLGGTIWPEYRINYL